MVALSKEYARLKKESYDQFNLKNTNFFEGEEPANPPYCPVRPTPGFFSSFRSSADFVDHVKAPMLMAVVCLKETLSHLITSFIHFGSSLIDLFTLNLKDANDSLHKGFESLYMASRFALSLLVDAVWQFAALTTRFFTTTVSGAIHLAAAGINGVCSLFAPNTPKKGDSESYGYDSSYDDNVSADDAALYLNI